MSNNRHATGLAERPFEDAGSALARVVLERTDVLTAERHVLHVGPRGDLRETLSTLANLDYCGVESASGALGGPMLPFVSESFDLVICDEVDARADERVPLGEVARLLRPGGRAVIGGGGAFEAFASHAGSLGLFAVWAAGGRFRDRPRGGDHGEDEGDVFLCVRGEF